MHQPSFATLFVDFKFGDRTLIAATDEDDEALVVVELGVPDTLALVDALRFFTGLIPYGEREHATWLPDRIADGVLFESRANPANTLWIRQSQIAGNDLLLELASEELTATVEVNCQQAPMMAELLEDYARQMRLFESVCCEVPVHGLLRGNAVLH